MTHDDWNVLFAFDMDGVLVDSAMETGLSGFQAAKIIFPNDDKDEWIQQLENDDTKKSIVLNRFCTIRPCLETGWEAALLIKLIATKMTLITDETILSTFQSTLKTQLLSEWNVTVETCKSALQQARNHWIENNKNDWIQSHGFYDGACNAIKQLLIQTSNNKNIFLITTKAAEYAKRLLEQQGLYQSNENEGNKEEEKNEIQNNNNKKSNTFRESNIYGLGSGSKDKVLASILNEQNNDVVDATTNNKMALIVEDNLRTLQRIMANDRINNHVLPILATWGYNTEEQCEWARNNGYIVLDDQLSLTKILSEQSQLPILLEQFQKKRQELEEK